MPVTTAAHYRSPPMLTIDHPLPLARSPQKEQQEVARVTSHAESLRAKELDRVRVRVRAKELLRNSKLQEELDKLRAEKTQVNTEEWC